jgi:hypothetical protein
MPFWRGDPCAEPSFMSALAWVVAKPTHWGRVRQRSPPTRRPGLGPEGIGLCKGSGGAPSVGWSRAHAAPAFASYRLAAIRDAPRVAAELGHTSPQMLYSTYRELVLPKEAHRYWKLTPAAELEKS